METVASKTFAVPRDGAGSHAVPGKRRLDEDLRRLLLDRAPPDRRVDDDAFTPDRLDRFPVDAERDPLDRREPGQRRDDLGDATEHRRAAATVVEAPVEVDGRHAVRERDVAQGVPLGIALESPAARSSAAGPSSSSVSAARATAGVDSIVRRTGLTFPSRRR